MAKSGVWETLKKPIFQKISIFEGCDGSRMPKMHSGSVQNIFEKFLKFFKFFTTPWPFSARILKFLSESEPQIAQSGVWQTMKNPNLRKFRFLRVVMVLECPKCILGKFRIFLKKFVIFFIFSPLLGNFMQAFWNFQAQNQPKMA